MLWSYVKHVTNTEVVNSGFRVYYKPSKKNSKQHEIILKGLYQRSSIFLNGANMALLSPMFSDVIEQLATLFLFSNTTFLEPKKGNNNFRRAHDQYHENLPLFPLTNFMLLLTRFFL